MNKTIFLILTLIVFQNCIAQNIYLDAKNLRICMDNLEATPDSLKFQNDYICFFPSSSEKFEKIFCEVESPLYGKEMGYSIILIQIIDKNPDIIGSKLLKICTSFSKKYLNNCSLGGLRYPTLNYIFHHPESFLHLFNKMKYRKQKKLVKYLADVENHDNYYYYQNIIDKYVFLDADISELFKRERDSRKRKH